MPRFFFSFNVLRREAYQLKGWSNRPGVPLTSSSGWRKKNSNSKPSPAPPSTSKLKPTVSSATSTTGSGSIYMNIIKPSLSPPLGAPNPSSRWTGGATTNVLLIHPICRCCTDVVNCITRPYKRRASKASMTTTGPAATDRSCSGMNSKAIWDGLPSTHYMRLWPQPDHEKLREAKFMSSCRSPGSRFAASCSPGSSSPPGEKKSFGKNSSSKKQKKRSSWKLWPSIF